jgi:hypothetical protein
LIGAVNTDVGYPIEATGYFSGVIDEVRYWDRALEVPEPAPRTLGVLALIAVYLVGRKKSVIDNAA